MSDSPLMTLTPTIPSSSWWLEDLQTLNQEGLVGQGEELDILKSVNNLMLEKNILVVPSCTSVNVAEENIKELIVPKEMRKRDEKVRDWKTFARNPRYRRGFIWGSTQKVDTPSVTSTLYWDPLPGVPISDYKHDLVTQTIENHSYLFKIVTPIWAHVLSSFLSTHPNQAFVKSIVSGFKTGFWPSADADKLQALPKGMDNHYKKDDKDNNMIDFLRSQRDIEIQSRRYSKSFGRILLPGTVAQPCFAVPNLGQQSFGWSMITQLEPIL